MLVYYAHPITDYNTEQETADIVDLKKLGFEVLNPNNKGYEIAYKTQGMQLFLNLIDNCDFLAFRGFKNNSSSIPSGVLKEINYAKELGKVIIEMPSNISSRGLSVEATRRLLKDFGRNSS